jgi:beta-lactam-binding protein with PASTA domain
VRLFADRAAAASPGFTLTDAIAPAVSALCLRLDGLPLAIELAASRVRSFGPADLVEHLDQRFELLSAGARTAVPRHRTLRGAIDWSYELLDDGERALFDRLGVFPADFDYEAVRSVCGADDLGGGAVMTLLPRLVDKSLVSVVGQTLDSARVELDRAGLKIDVRRRADRAPADIVFDQAPNPGQKVDSGSSVAVFVSNGPGTVKVPDVIGLTQTDARRRLRALKLRPQVVRESSAKVADGLVIRTDPGPGRPVDSESTVTVVVSTGPEQVQVPDVTGLDQTDAVAQLREKGLTAVVQEKASSEPTGTVVSQTPAGGQQIDQGSSVTIFVSKGKVMEVPDVCGVSQAEAEGEITDAGFTPSVRTRDTTQPDEDGTVLSQSPKGGTKRKEGTTVTITVGRLVTSQPGASP